MDFIGKDKTEDSRESKYEEFIGFVRGIESNIEELMTLRSARAPLTDEDERTYEVAVKREKLALIEGCRRLKDDQETG